MHYISASTKLSFLVQMQLTTMLILKQGKNNLCVSLSIKNDTNLATDNVAS